MCQDLGRAPGVLHLLPITQPPVELDPRLDQLPLLPLHVGLRGPDRALGGLLFHGHRRLVRAEVAAVPAHLARPQLADLVHHLQQFPVVADEDDCPAPRIDGLVQPLPRHQVQVVRRLVKQQHAGAAQELRGQAQQHRLTTGQLTDPPVQRHLVQAEPVQRGPGPLLGVPVVADAGEVLLAGVPGLDRADGCHDPGDAEGLVNPRFRRAKRQVLRQVAQFSGDGDRTGRRGQLPGDQPQQRGLAGPVDADQAGAPRADHHGEIVEDRGPVRPGERKAGTGDGGRWRGHARLLCGRPCLIDLCRRERPPAGWIARRRRSP
jgi:hypothetical protein